MLILEPGEEVIMRESTKWTVHFITGAIIVVVLGIHFLVMHLDYIMYSLGLGDKDPLTYTSVAARSKMIFHVIVYLVLLGAALFHGFYGLRSIIFELAPGRKLEKAVSATVILVGLLLFLYGAQAIIRGYVS